MSIQSVDAGVTVRDGAGGESLSGLGRGFSNRQRRGAEQRVTLVIQHMLRHVGEPLRVSDFSALAGISASYLGLLFKSATGHAPIEFFIRLRMECACELLGDPALRVKDIAFSLGYQDQFYFSRLFKLATGVAPTEYRATVFKGAEPVARSPQGDWRSRSRNWAPLAQVALAHSKATSRRGEGSPGTNHAETAWVDAVAWPATLTQNLFRTNI